jgi:hypothetical protein
MTNTTRKVICVGVGMVLSLLIATLALQSSEKPRQTAEQSHLESQKLFQRELEALHARNESWESLPANEKEIVLLRSREAAEKESRRMIEVALKVEAEVQPVENCYFSGLRFPDREPAVDVPFHSWDFRVQNFWGGTISHVCFQVYAGFSPTDPAQGVLAVFSDPEEPWRYKLYPTPTPTGPVHVVAESMGLIVLRSEAGTFERLSNESGLVQKEGPTVIPTKTSGGTTYIFDLRTLRYR